MYRQCFYLLDNDQIETLRLIHVLEVAISIDYVVDL